MPKYAETKDKVVVLVIMVMSVNGSSGKFCKSFLSYFGFMIIFILFKRVVSFCL